MKIKLRLRKKAFTLFFLFTICAIGYGQITVDCPDSLPNENTAILLPSGTGFLGIDEAIGTSEVTNGSECALALVNNDSGEIFANYRIPIDLAAYDSNPGDNLFISLDGNSSEGVARIEVLRDNTPNQAAFSQTFVGGWSTISTTIVVPADLTSLDIWLYSNYLSNEPGTAYYDNLVVTNLWPNAVPLQANTMSLFPNPANESVSMTFETPTEVLEFQVFDVSGRLIRTVKMDKRSQEYQLNVSDLQPGTYFIQTMDSDGKLYDKQMLIER